MIYRRLNVNLTQYCDIVNAWNLVVYELYTKLGEMTPQGIKTWEISPYAISFRVQSEDNAYSSMSIQQALDESFNWLTSNNTALN